MRMFDGQRGKRASEAEYLKFTHKRCPVCERVKAVSQFYKKKTTTARGWAWDSYCIECRRMACAEYGKQSNEVRNARLRTWRKKNPSAARAVDKRRRLKRRYGLSPDAVESMRTAQGGKCAICSRETRRLFVDHCHTTNRVRALLCQTCNTFLGWYERKADTIIRFQHYLEAHR